VSNVKHRCMACNNQGFAESVCPECNSDRVVKMCSEDHLCTCNGDVHEGIRYCPVCKEITCPCGCHDVAGISRVTGYLQDVSGWNAGKQQELKDRKRCNIGDD
jgi:hypothetical protein